MDTGSSDDFQMQLEQHQVMVIQLKEMIRERENQLQQKEKELQVGPSFNFVLKKPSYLTLPGFLKHIDTSFRKLVWCCSSSKILNLTKCHVLRPLNRMCIIHCSVLPFSPCPSHHETITLWLYGLLTHSHHILSSNNI